MISIKIKSPLIKNDFQLRIRSVEDVGRQFAFREKAECILLEKIYLRELCFRIPNYVSLLSSRRCLIEFSITSV